MSADRSVIEFYRLSGEDDAGLLLSIETEAAPPPMSALVNILNRDYRVAKVDYSIDHPTGGPRIYRRNVYMTDAS